MVVVSYMTEEPDYTKIKDLTFATTSNEHHSASKASWDWRDVAASLFVVGGIVAGYLYFVG